MTFTTTKNIIQPEKLKAQLQHPAAGGFAAFEGWVRDHNDGKKVRGLDYELYPELVKNEAAKIFAEAHRKFDLIGLAAEHRYGSLQIGDLAVWVGATAKHRAEAFAACRYVIDELKLRLPIWKKEHYLDGKAHWVNCAGCQGVRTTSNYPNESRGSQGAQGSKVSKDAFYKHQLTLKEVGTTGQAQLDQAKVLVVGAGGLGCAALMTLAGAGVGSIIICDHDQIELSNLHRQFIYSTADVGMPKAAKAAEFLQARNPFIKVTDHCLRVQDQNIASLSKYCDVIVDCSDNFETQSVIHDFCIKKEIPLVLANLHSFEGEIQVFHPSYPEGGCLYCQRQTPPDTKNTCLTNGVLGGLAQTIGHLQALEVIKVILGQPSDALQHSLLVDSLGLELLKLRRKKQRNCHFCTSLPEAQASKPVPHKSPKRNTPLPDFGSHWDTLRDSNSNTENRLIINVSRNDSAENLKTRFDYHITSWPELIDTVESNPSKEIYLSCEQGFQSVQLAKRLHSKGYENVRALKADKV